ncbi:MAG: ABC transporter permease, partial [Candidatus Hydrogenedentes bacterium]|nr:ABC transporter permease [Candidatus Hydrogenedentota bacterium]
MRYSFLPFWGLLKRELIRDLRRPRPIVLLGGVLAVATFVIMTAYPNENVSPMQMRMQSMWLLGGLTATLMFAAIFLLPGYAATAIVSERESDTYDLLALTLTRPIVIVLGKLASSLGYFLLVVIGTLPLIGTTMFLVGIDPGSIAASGVYLSIIAMTCTSMGIMGSALVRSTPRAVLLAYISTFVALGGFVIPILLLYGVITVLELTLFEPIVRWLLNVAASLSPFGGGAMVAIGGVTSVSHFTVSRFILGQGLFSLLALLIARRMLVQQNEERSFTTVALPPPLPVSPGEAPPRRSANWARMSLPQWPPVPDGANPMLARELLQLKITQRLTPLRILLLLACILPIMAALHLALGFDLRVTPGDANTAMYAWVIGLAVLMAFVAPASVAAAWTREYERESMDLLRTSLITPRQLVYGKIGAALRACVLPFAMTVFASLPLLRFPFLQPAAFQILSAGLVTLLVMTVLSVSIASIMGLLTRRTSAAILYAFGGSMTVLCSPFLINAALSILIYIV